MWFLRDNASGREGQGVENSSGSPATLDGRACIYMRGGADAASPFKRTPSFCVSYFDAEMAASQEDHPRKQRLRIDFHVEGTYLGPKVSWVFTVQGNHGPSDAPSLAPNVFAGCIVSRASFISTKCSLERTAPNTAPVHPPLP